MEQQQRQLDRMHQEREAHRLQQQEEMLRQKAQEEMQRRIQYQKEQQLKLQREAQERMLLEQQRLKEEQRKQEEAERQAEEARKREEERRELEKVLAIREEQRRKQKEALETHTAMKEKADSIPINIHLAGCHTLTKLVNHLPFPTPFVPHSNQLKVNVHPDYNSQLENTDMQMAVFLANALAECDVNDVSLKHKEGETNEIDTTSEPALVRNILAHNQRAFDVEPVIGSVNEEPLIPMEILSSHLKEEDAAERHHEGEASTSSQEGNCSRMETGANIDSVKNEGGVNDENINNSNSNMDNNSNSNSILNDQEQTAQLRKQIVSLGKQPKAQQGRKKKDMV
ncbi:unnamed protein product, partial [Anisakis simplex]